MKRLLLLTVAITLLGAAPASAQIAPGSGREEVVEDAVTQTIIVNFINGSRQTFVTELLTPNGSSVRARFYLGDAGGNRPSWRLINEMTVELGRRDSGSFDRELRINETRDCFVAYLRGDGVEVRPIKSKPSPNPDRGKNGFEATSGQVCVALGSRPSESDLGPGDGDGDGEGDGASDDTAPVPANRHLIGMRPRSRRTRTVGRPLYRPRTLLVSPGVSLVGVRWQTWATENARGQGTVRIGPPRGDLRYVRGARVRLFGLRTGVCRGVPVRFYTRAVITFPSASRLLRVTEIGLIGAC